DTAVCVAGWPMGADRAPAAGAARACRRD
ncbi:MAG: hypothetical protein AVDCRST_MAG18-1804, partial [uncultured Thermomicrobiales bacterium]